MAGQWSGDGRAMVGRWSGNGRAMVGQWSGIGLRQHRCLYTLAEYRNSSLSLKEARHTPMTK
eukprot:1019440-Lingulodinium_polyedra.AAC.1